MPDEVRGGGVDHDPPQYSWYIYTPYFYSSSAARPFSPIRSMSSVTLLLHYAVDMEVHGGLIEARSVTNHVTLRLLWCTSRRKRAERGAKQNFSSPNPPSSSLVQALTARGVWPGRPLAPGLPRPCCRRLAAGSEGLH